MTNSEIENPLFITRGTAVDWRNQYVQDAGLPRHRRTARTAPSANKEPKPKAVTKAVK